VPYAETNGARIYYQQHGSGPDVVFLHGAGGNHLSWWQQLAAFGDTYSCTAWDARGWGLSRAEEGQHDRFAFGPDLVGLFDHLGIERAHIIAQSMGGRAVAGLVRLAPERVRSITLCGTTAGATNDRIRELQDELKEVRGDASLREFSLAPEFEQREPGLTLLYRQINALNPPRPKGLLGRPPPTYRGSMHGPIAATGAPVLFAVGEHDLITSPEMIREAQSLIPGARYYELKGAGHSAYFESADEWNGVVINFIESVESGTKSG
jgi:pimeloyl-ACP methyl ester carboxylesterase